jgi:hypothetical protein
MRKRNITNICISICVLIILGVLSISLTGCTEAERVDENLTQEAENFNVYRRITVINCITGDTLYTCEGWCNIKADTEDNQLEIIAEVDNDKYYKHFIGGADNLTYIVEQLDPADVSKYHFEINMNPNLWIPYEPTTIN